MLARKFSVNRTTFYRHYSAITDATLDTAAHQQTEWARKGRTRADDRDKRDETIRRLRSENNDFRRHVEIYEKQIRMLSIENQRQRLQLERLAGLSDLHERRTR